MPLTPRSSRSLVTLSCHTSTDTLPGTPVQALRDDRHTEVTRRAQALAL